MTARTEFITKNNHIWLLGRALFPAGDESTVAVHLIISYVWAKMLPYALLILALDGGMLLASSSSFFNPWELMPVPV
jgi:hypothetical protein